MCQEEEHRQLTFPIRVVSTVRTLHGLLRANTVFLLTRSLFFFRQAGLFNGDEGLFNGDEFFCFLLFFAIPFENRLDVTASLDDSDLFFDPVRGVDGPIPAKDGGSVGFFFCEVSREELLVFDWLAARSDLLVPTDFEASGEGVPLSTDFEADDKGVPLFVVWAMAR